MKAALQIAGKDLKLRLRDRSVFILGILAPFALAFIFSRIFGPAADTSTFDLEIGLVDQDQSEISQAFGQVLQGADEADVLTLVRYPDRDGAIAGIENGEVGAVLQVPSGLGQAVQTGSAATIDVVGDVDSPVTTQIAVAFAERFSSSIAAGQLGVTTAAVMSDSALTPEFLASLTTDPAIAGTNFNVVNRSAETKQLDATTYFVASMAVFFLFFTVQFGVSGLLEEEREGTMPRLMASPISRSSVVVGKAILSFVIGVVAMAVLLASATFVMGAKLGSPLGVTVLVVAGVLAATGIMGMVAAVAKTPEGAGNLGSIIAVILGMLGGAFFPIGSSGGLLSNLTLLTPHAWFLRGLTDLTAEAPWTAALPAAGAILMFAIVAGVIASLLLRRRWQA